MKDKIKKTIPKSIKRNIKRIINNRILKQNFQQDFKRYKNYSYEYTEKKNKRHLESELIFYYHKIEKGLSLPEPRLGFGKNIVYHLLSLIEEYVETYGWDEISVISLNTLFAYYQFNENNNLIMDKLLIRIEKLKKSMELGDVKTSQGGIIEVTKSEIDNSAIDFKNFAYSRYSIRNFGDGNVSMTSIREAVYIAQKTPSACNRQSSKVYVYSDPIFKKEILSYQNGNSGFGDSASKILIVTSELNDFRGSKERNQCYIDGGMYSMSLIYALHSLGLGTCPLNLSLNYEAERNLKKAANISNSEVLLMMIAVGNLPNKLNVAASPRRAPEEVMSVF